MKTKRQPRIFSRGELLTKLRADVLAYISQGGSQRAWAETYGIDPGYLSRMLNGEHPLNQKALDALGYEKVVTITYRKKQDAK